MQSPIRLFGPAKAASPALPPVPAETAPRLPSPLPAPRPFLETEPAVMPYVPTEFDIPL
jgi:hypothetical protein